MRDPRGRAVYLVPNGERHEHSRARSTGLGAIRPESCLLCCIQRQTRLRSGGTLPAPCDRRVRHASHGPCPAGVERRSRVERGAPEEADSTPTLTLATSSPPRKHPSRPQTAPTVLHNLNQRDPVRTSRLHQSQHLAFTQLRPPSHHPYSPAMCKHILNAQVAIRSPCCQKWFDVS
jgi:hypothetical protein